MVVILCCCLCSNSARELESRASLRPNISKDTLLYKTSIMAHFGAPTQYYPHKFTQKKIHQRVRHLKINKVQLCASSDLDLEKIHTDECK